MSKTDILHRTVPNDTIKVSLDYANNLKNNLQPK